MSYIQTQTQTDSIDQEVISFNPSETKESPIVKYATIELIRKRAAQYNIPLSDVEEITLHQYDLTHLGPVLEKVCPNLQILYLQGNALDSIRKFSFSNSFSGFVGHFKRLRYINLAVNSIWSISPELAKCERLEKLDLTGNRIHDILSFFNLKRLYSLKSIFLAGNPCVEYQYHKEYLVTTLSRLELLDGEKTSQLRHQLNSLQSGPSLKNLAIDENEEGEENCSSLLQCTESKNLSKTNLILYYETLVGREQERYERSQQNQINVAQRIDVIWKWTNDLELEKPRRKGPTANLLAFGSKSLNLPIRQVNKPGWDFSVDIESKRFLNKERKKGIFSLLKMETSDPNRTFFNEDSSNLGNSTWETGVISKICIDVGKYAPFQKLICHCEPKFFYVFYQHDDENFGGSIGPRDDYDNLEILFSLALESETICSKLTIEFLPTGCMVATVPLIPSLWNDKLREIEMLARVEKMEFENTHNNKLVLMEKLKQTEASENKRVTQLLQEMPPDQRGLHSEKISESNENIDFSDLPELI